MVRRKTPLMIKTIAQALGLADSPAGAVARRAFETEHPQFKCGGTQIRATEESRFVVAVFYSQPGLHERPGPYLLYAVARDLGSAQELACSPESPYWIRGRK
jgi:hypothetical protein